MRHFLVTGGTGFIGKAFIQTLSADHCVTVLTRDSSKAQALLQGAKCETRFIPSLDNISHLDDFDYVLNLAGEPIADKRWTQAQMQVIQSSRWQITQQLTTLFSQSSKPPQLFISGSAIGFYGRQGQTPITEDNYTTNDEFTHQLCVTWEDYALAAQSEHTRVCLLRTGIVLDKGKGALGKMILPFKLGLGGPIGNGEQGMSWIHIDDMVAGIHFLIHNPTLQGAFNFTAPTPVSNKQFTQDLGKALNRPAFMPIPAFALSMLMGKGSDLLLTGQFVLPEKLQRNGFEFKYPKLPDALAAIY